MTTIRKKIAIDLGNEAKAAGVMDVDAAWKVYNDRLRAAGVDTAIGSYDVKWAEFKAVYTRTFKGQSAATKSDAKSRNDLYDFARRNRDEDSDEWADR
jgi:hypothetical protein